MARYPQILSVHLFLLRDDEILLQLRKNTGYRDGCWSVIAGHVEAKESATNAMMREAKEESGILLDSKDLVLVHVMHRFENQERVDFFFKANKWKGEPVIMEPNKAGALEWVRLSELPYNVVPYVKQAIELGLKKGQIYSEYGWT
ncbi:NUDIX hydrolase [Acidianus brierleyi]|uniref:NUDIX hydrolase n=1 Tax=Acidianus brierleyi TaxID=41673 RepID=A0A2U9IHV6_9CREN|nr:NUDIX domain-containing protein [Acidianus brierleyi]AWR95609.1 NUDIX domain-containing protein [Acidianus brierleyi]